MSELSDESKAFLAAHADEGLPTAEEQLRVRAAVRSAIDAAPRAVETGSAGSFSLGKLVVGVTAAMLIGSGAALLFRPEVSSTSPPPAREAPVTAAPMAPPTPAPPTAAEAPAPASPAGVRRERPAQQPPPAQSTGTRPEATPPSQPMPTPTFAEPPLPQPTTAEPIDPAEEFRLIAQAQASTREGNPGWALELLTQHERRFGDGGLLAEEAHAARVKALCGLGRVAEARVEAERLETMNPSSVHLARIARACW